MCLQWNFLLRILINSEVTICPIVTRTALDYDSLSLENYDVSWDAELSRILNPGPILSHFECNVMSRLQCLYL